jgi:hypothetical protein
MMTRILSCILLLLLAISWPTSSSGQAATDTSAAAPDSAEVEEEEKKRDPKFMVGFDVGVEVLFTMVRLREARPGTTFYQAEIDSIFGPFADHPAVHSVGDLLDRGARFEVLLNTLLCRGPAPDFSREFPYWTPDSTAVGASDEDRARLLSAVRSFYRDTQFQEFWDPRWEEIKEPEGDSLAIEEPGPVEVTPDTSATSDSLDVVPPLWARGYEAVEDSLYVLLHAEMAQEPYQMYYGSRGNSIYRFVPTWQSPVDTALATRSAEKEILAWVVPMAPDSVALFDRDRLDRRRAQELGIVVVEPLAEWLWPYLEEYKFLFRYLMRGRGRLGTWDSWGGCFVEHLRRAVHARILLATQGEEPALDYMDRMMDEGYGLLPILYENLERYETNRNRYLSLPDFTPELISVLGTVDVEVISREPAFGARFRPAADGGLEITEIFEGLTADRARIRVGDVLISIDGRPVAPETDVEALTRERGVGGRMVVEVLRQDRIRELTLLLGADLINYRFYGSSPPEPASPLSSPAESADQQ